MKAKSTGDVARRPSRQIGLIVMRKSVATPRRRPTKECATTSSTSRARKPLDLESRGGRSRNRRIPAPPRGSSELKAHLPIDDGERREVEEGRRLLVVRRHPKDHDLDEDVVEPLDLPEP